MSIEHREVPPQREPVIATVDLSDGWDKESMRDILIERLKELAIYQPNLLFRGFNGNKIEVVKQYGSDNPNTSTVYCSKESELADEYAMAQSALDYALRQDQAGLAVYEGDKLEQGAFAPPYRYKAKKGISLKEALLAVLVLK